MAVSHNPRVTPMLGVTNKPQPLLGWDHSSKTDEDTFRRLSDAPFKRPDGRWSFRRPKSGSSIKTRSWKINIHQHTSTYINIHLHLLYIYMYIYIYVCVWSIDAFDFRHSTLKKNPLEQLKLFASHRWVRCWALAQWLHQWGLDIAGWWSFLFGKMM